MEKEMNWLWDTIMVVGSLMYTEHGADNFQDLK